MLSVGYLLVLFMLLISAVIPHESGDSGFLWGAATAAYQVEGAALEDGRGACIWDTFVEIPGKIANGDTGKVAADSYHLYEEDVKLLRNMGLNSYRFSVSWSRILPDGTIGYVNEKGIQYYNNLIDELVKYDIEPLVTLYHWDLPQALEDKYEGWLSSKVVDDFKAYSEICFAAFGDRVKKWVTLNEPWSFTYMGYVTGSFAPGRCGDRSKCPRGDSATEGYIAAHNALNAHAAAVDVYRRKYQQRQGGHIGIVLNHDFGWAASRASKEDQEAAERHNVFQSAWFGDPITFGDYPELMRQLVGDRLPEFSDEQSRLLKGSYDFLGLNHYTTRFYSMRGEQERDRERGKRALFGSVGDTEPGWQGDQGNIESQKDVHGRNAGPQAASPWLQMVPDGFKDAILWNSHRYGKPAMYITENGCDVPGESAAPLKEALQDGFRISYYQRYLGAMQQAKALGADVRGYFAWSLLDNFEWSDGYNFRFGLTYVDYDSPARTRIPKDSSRWYGKYVAASRGQIHYGRHYRHSPTEKRNWLQYLMEALYRQPWPSIAEL